jgi:hypothetical protein
LPDRTLNKSSKEAHIWHTKRRRKTNLRGVLEQVSLIEQINGVFRLGGVSMQRGIQVSSQFEKGTSEFPGREFLAIRRYLLYRRPLSSPFHGGILANLPGMLEKSWADSLKH